jgi:diaminopimelate decarboxylase|tara:strand:- start:11137 stop:12522 length:1386 start_codon:yes stop_codon:yes gene_type:complete
MSEPILHYPLSIRDGHLFIEDCDTVELAERFGTPLFVVSESLLVRNAHNYQAAFTKHWPEGRARIMAAIKANPITAVRRILTREGIGCDTFGPGELELAIRGGVPNEDIAVNGSIKNPGIIRKAIERDIHIVLDSPVEVSYCEAVARDLGKKAQVMLRLKPFLEDLDLPSDFFPSRTIREMTQTVKYGIPNSELLPLVPIIRDSDFVELVGVHTHSGRHSKKDEFWVSLVKNTVKVIKQISVAYGDNWSPHIVSIGGGFAAEHDIESRVAVTDYPTPSVDRFAEMVCSTFRDTMSNVGLETAGLIFEVEPGRAIHNETGIHLAKVHVTKHETATIDRRWVETDTSEVFLSIGGLNQDCPFPYVFANKADEPRSRQADIVGITCNYECLAENAPVPESIAPDDIIAFLNTGSYIEVYAANFNALPRPGTVLVSGDRAEIIKRHETIEEVFSRDVVPAHLENI